MGVALALRFARGGVWMVVLVSPALFGAYYATLIAGETLADRLVVTPFVAMWGANFGLLAVAWLLSVRRRRGADAAGGRPLAVGS